MFSPLPDSLSQLSLRSPVLKLPFLPMSSPPFNHKRKRTTDTQQASTSTTQSAQDTGAIRCICDFTEDDGHTIFCDGCGYWQHMSCVLITPDSDDDGESSSSSRRSSSKAKSHPPPQSLPEKWFCEICVPRHVDAAAARLRQAHRLKADRERREAAEAEIAHRRRRAEAEKKRRMSLAANAQSTTADGLRRPRGSSGATRKSQPGASSHAQKSRRSSSVEISPQEEDALMDPWSGEYTRISQDVIADDSVRFSISHWRSTLHHQPRQDASPSISPLTACLPLPSPTKPSNFRVLVRPVPPSECTPLPCPTVLSSPAPTLMPTYHEKAAVDLLPNQPRSYNRPPTYGLYTAPGSTPNPSSNNIIPAGTLLTIYASHVLPLSSYTSAPLSQYSLLHLPKPHVRLVPPPLSLALDAREMGNESRFIRNGCHPNAVLRPVISPNESEGVVWGVYSTQEMSARGEEIVLGWEWDRASVVHRLGSLLEWGCNDNQDEANVKAQMSQILYTLAGTFTSCACGKQRNASTRDCVFSQMARFVYTPSPSPSMMTMECDERERERLSKPFARSVNAAKGSPARVDLGPMVGWASTQGQGVGVLGLSPVFPTPAPISISIKEETQPPPPPPPPPAPARKAWADVVGLYDAHTSMPAPPSSIGIAQAFSHSHSHSYRSREFEFDEPASTSGSESASPAGSSEATESSPPPPSKRVFHMDRTSLPRISTNATNLKEGMYLPTPLSMASTTTTHPTSHPMASASSLPTFGLHDRVAAYSFSSPVSSGGDSGWNSALAKRSMSGRFPPSATSSPMTPATNTTMWDTASPHVHAHDPLGVISENGIVDSSVGDDGDVEMDDGCAPINPPPATVVDAKLPPRMRKAWSSSTRRSSMSVVEPLTDRASLSASVLMPPPALPASSAPSSFGSSPPGRRFSSSPSPLSSLSSPPSPTLASPSSPPPSFFPLPRETTPPPPPPRVEETTVTLSNLSPASLPALETPEIKVEVGVDAVPTSPIPEPTSTPYALPTQPNITITTFPYSDPSAITQTTTTESLGIVSPAPSVEPELSTPNPTHTHTTVEQSPVVNLPPSADTIPEPIMPTSAPTSPPPREPTPPPREPTPPPEPELATVRVSFSDWKQMRLVEKEKLALAAAEADAQELAKAGPMMEVVEPEAVELKDEAVPVVAAEPEPVVKVEPIACSGDDLPSKMAVDHPEVSTHPPHDRPAPPSEYRMDVDVVNFVASPPLQEVDPVCDEIGPEDFSYPYPASLAPDVMNVDVKPPTPMSISHDVGDEQEDGEILSSPHEEKPNSPLHPLDNQHLPMTPARSPPPSLPLPKSYERYRTPPVYPIRGDRYVPPSSSSRSYRPNSPYSDPSPPISPHPYHHHPTYSNTPLPPPPRSYSPAAARPYSPSRPPFIPDPRSAPARWHANPRGPPPSGPSAPSYRVRGSYRDGGRGGGGGGRGGFDRDVRERERDRYRDGREREKERERLDREREANKWKARRSDY